MTADMNIHSTEGVIHDVEISIAVNCSGQGNALFLATTQVDALLTNLSVHASRQHLQQQIGLHRNL